jgi:hypothetical protein
MAEGQGIRLALCRFDTKAPYSLIFVIKPSSSVIILSQTKETNMVASLGKIHQSCMEAMIRDKLVPGDPGMAGGGMDEFRKREALLVDRLLLERTGVDAGAAFAVTDMANFLRGAGIQVTDEQIRKVHEDAIKSLLDIQPQQPGQPVQQDMPKPEIKAGELACGQKPMPVQGKHSQGVVVNRQQNVVQIRIGGL